MNAEAASTLDEADLALWIVDASQAPEAEDVLIADLLNRQPRSLPLLVVLNKIDLLPPDSLPARQREFAALAERAEIRPVSSLRGDGLKELLEAILERLPEGHPFFPGEQVTDLYERDLAADLIREACLNILRDEVPHGIAVRVDQFTERGENGAYIEATLIVEKESHKGIVIGGGGTMIKQIGAAARQEIEAMSGRKVYLLLNVKVRKNWRDDEKTIRSFGY
jgi:GTP-binding protein Era